jgi:TrmH family RNA methyltransferase
MISSTSNSQVREIIRLQTQAKARKKAGVFVVEGSRIFTEIPENRLHKAYVSASFYDSIKDISCKIMTILDKVDYEIVEDSVFKQMSDTVTPQGILAIVNKRELNIQDISEGSTYIILENLQDPGNLGTILRTAEGAGISGIIMNRGTVDIYNSKVVRSTMGAIFRVPFMYSDNIDATVQQLKNSGVKIYAAHLNGKKIYNQPDYSQPSAFMIGNEGNGLSEELSSLADELIIIPMAGKVESLNAANAATILMYEAFRQRGFK